MISAEEGRIVVGTGPRAGARLFRILRPAADASPWETDTNVTATVSSTAIRNFIDALSILSGGLEQIEARLVSYHFPAMMKALISNLSKP